MSAVTDATVEFIENYTGNPQELVNVWYALAERIKDLEFPRAYVKEMDEDEDGETITTLRCGNCHEVLADSDEGAEEFVVVDWATRWTAGPSISFTDQDIHFEYDGGGDFEGLHYRCNHCDFAIRLPENWIEN
jgi:hypothetical protein